MKEKDLTNPKDPTYGVLAKQLFLNRAENVISRDPQCNQRKKQGVPRNMTVGE